MTSPQDVKTKVLPDDKLSAAGAGGPGVIYLIISISFTAFILLLHELPVSEIGRAHV